MADDAWLHFRGEIFDIVIAGGTLLPMTTPASVVGEPLIGISRGKIRFVAQGAAGQVSALKAREVIDASGCLILPGLINAHTHLPMTLFRGLADDLPLMGWLHDHIFPAERRFIDRDSVHLCATLAIAEMIRSGTTTFCDGYFYEDAVAEAALSAGIRGVVAQGFIDSPMPDRSSRLKQTGCAKRFLQRWRDRSPLVTPALVCHSAYLCSPDTLQTIKAETREAGVPFMLHLAETREEVQLIKDRYGKRPVFHLQELGLLDGSTIAAHGTWLDDEELDLLSRQKVKIVHNPESNMKLGAGVAPLPSMLKRGILVGLGTDGCASNNDLDLFGEMAMCARLHKAFTGDPTVVGAEKVLEMATVDGAEVLGMSDRIGSLSPGKAADLILLDIDQPHWTPLYNPFSQVVYAASGADVKTSIIAGKIIMRDRRLLTIDLEPVMKEVQALAADVARCDVPHALAKRSSPAGQPVQPA
jgi:5-methylthioadenosine/S-adenosylhomocysteine deaminase